APLIELDRAVVAPPGRQVARVDEPVELADHDRAAPPLGLTLGLVLAVTLGALESLTVVSVMPLVARELDGLSLYGWVFAGYFITSAVAIPLTARSIDRSGLRLPFTVGLALFGGGLLVSGLAPTME